MQKAYDKVKWNFILTVLKCFGFGEKFITLMRQCITSVSFTLLLNGSPCSRIDPSRGDPLSPYLFFFLCRNIVQIVAKRRAVGSLKGVKVTKRKEVEVMADCVEKYCRWSGQTVNLAKSGIFTSKNVSRASLQSLSRNWGCRTINLDSKYLGNTKKKI